MNAERLQADEYELQYYGSSSTEIAVEFAECIDYHLKDVLDSVEKAWLERNPHYDSNMIKTQMADLQKLYQTAMKDTLKKFEETLREIFHIHPNVILEGQEIYQKKYTSEEVTALRGEVESLEQDFLREKLFIRKLKEHKNVIDKLKPLYESTNIRIKAVQSLKAADTKIEMINTLLKLQKDHINYCSNNKSDLYNKCSHLFTTESADKTN